MVMVPHYCIRVERQSRIKPEINPLFPVTLPMSIDVGLDGVRLAGPVAQELEIELVTHRVGVGVHLIKTTTKI